MNPRILTAEENNLFRQMAQDLGGLDGRYCKDKLNSNQCYKLKCPRCNKGGAKFDISKRNDNYILVCPSPEYGGCGLSMLLHQVIAEYGNDGIKLRLKELQKRWLGEDEYEYSNYKVPNYIGWDIINNGVRRKKVTYGDLDSIWTRLTFAGVIPKDFIPSQNNLNKILPKILKQLNKDSKTRRITK